MRKQRSNENIRARVPVKTNKAPKRGSGRERDSWRRERERERTGGNT